MSESNEDIAAQSVQNNSEIVQKNNEANNTRIEGRLHIKNIMNVNFNGMFK